MELTRIFTSYRQWDFLRLWIDNDALFAPGIHWVIVNDCPQDPCPEELLEKLQARGTKTMTPLTNLGRCGARNWAAREASTYWIEHIDGDDLPLPIDLNELNRHTDADVVSFPVLGYQRGDDLSKLDCSPQSFPWEVSLEHYSRTARRFHPIDWRPVGTLWRRDSYLSLHGYDARFDDSYEDMQLMWRAHNAGFHCAHVATPKQAFHTGDDPNRPPRLTATSTFRYWQYISRFGTEEDKLLAREQIPAACHQLFWQAIRQLKTNHAASWGFRLRQILKLLTWRF